MHELVESHYAYNTWATEQLIDAMRNLSREEYTTVEASGNGSIRDTFAHFLSVQWGWFSWFDGSLTASDAVSRTIDPEEIDTVARAEERWQAVDEQTRRCIDRLDSEQLAEIWSWELPWNTGALPLWKLVTHVANHQTHTRAQIVAAIRRAGHEPGVYEYLYHAIASSDAGS